VSKTDGRGDLTQSYRYEETERRVEHMIRVGRVVEANYSHPAWLRVKLDGEVSAKLPIGTMRAGGNREWHPYEVGEQVLVYAPAGVTNGAFVLGAVPCNDFPAPDDSPERYVMRYKDDTLVRYDREQHHFDIENPNGDGRYRSIVTDHSEIIQDNDHIKLRIGETFIEIRDGSIELNVNGTTAKLTPDLLAVSAALATFSGNVEIDQNLFVGQVATAGVDVIAGPGISLVFHIHSGVWTGPEVSGPPIPGS
jgi:phage baseplate assembly protein V